MGRHCRLRETIFQLSTISGTLPIAGPKYDLPQEVQKAVIENSKDFLSKYNERFELNFDLRLRTTQTESPTAIWEEETVLSIARLLNEMSSKLEHAKTNVANQGKLHLISENKRLLAREAQHLGDYREAQNCFEEAIFLSKNFKAYRDYAILLQTQKKFDKALEMCRHAIDLEPLRPRLTELRSSIIN